MANRTASYATTIHGTNPQYLIEKIIRTRIYDSRFWKEQCCQINSADVLDKACDLRYVGGIYGGHSKPVPFICLALKLLQIQPSKEIVDFFIDQTEFKYLRALGAFYLRLVAKPVEIYKKLEPLYRDFRKLRLMDRSQKFKPIHMDKLIDNLLREERMFDVILPRLTKRTVLESNKELELYKSELEDLNLIPAQIIQEKVETKKDDMKDLAQTYYRHDKHRDNYNLHSGQSSRNNSRDNKSSRTCGFKQEEINGENAIRAMLGIKPLRV